MSVRWGGPCSLLHSSGSENCLSTCATPRSSRYGSASWSTGVPVAWKLRQRGVVLPGRRRPFVPWKDVLCVERCKRGRKLLVQHVDGDFVIRTAPAHVEAAMPVLLPRVRVRDETGKVVNGDRELLKIELPPGYPASRYQFRLRTLLLLMLVASAAFGWVAIERQVRRQEDAVLAKYERFGPRVHRFGNGVEDLDFSRCSARLHDDDLVYLKDLPQLQNLNLENTSITDAGLEHLESLRQIEAITLTGTQVTDDGVRKAAGSLAGGEDSITERDGESRARRRRPFLFVAGPQGPRFSQRRRAPSLLHTSPWPPHRHTAKRLRHATRGCRAAARLPCGSNDTGYLLYPIPSGCGKGIALPFEIANHRGARPSVARSISSFIIATVPWPARGSTRASRRRSWPGRSVPRRRRDRGARRGGSREATGRRRWPWSPTA